MPTVLLPLLEAVAKLNKPLLLIGSEIEQEALATLLVNRLKGSPSSVRPSRRRAPVIDARTCT